MSVPLLMSDRSKPKVTKRPLSVGCFIFERMGKIDVLYASAGTGESAKLGEITEQHFNAAFSLNARGTLFTVQKALPLFNDGGSIIMTGSVTSLKGFPAFGVYAASKAALRSFART
jgi:NAD(P)-dependent dehydrogenase (short-subunit alcohol dehydrogenase family)